MKNLLLKKEFLLGIKIISIISALLLTIVETSNQISRPVFTTDFVIDFYSLEQLIGNSIVILIFLYLTLYPHKLEFLAITSFYYSFMGITFDLDNPMGVCMFFLGVTVLYIRGYFISKKKRKCIVLAVLYIVMICSSIHFGLSEFLDSLLNKLGYTLVLSIIFFLLVACNYNLHFSGDQTKRVLNLSNYPELVEKDVSLLKKVLENKQYKVIALEVSRSEGTIRNRLNMIYDVLGVMDRMGFISTYIGYEIVFKDEKKKKVYLKQKIFHNNKKK